ARPLQRRRLDGARRAATRVDRQLRRPVAAAEVLVVLGLDAGLPDRVRRLVAELLVRLVLGRRDRTDVAEDVRRERLVRVLAQVALRELHAGERRLVLGEIGDLVRVDAVLDDDRRQRVAGR